MFTELYTILSIGLLCGWTQGNQNGGHGDDDANIQLAALLNNYKDTGYEDKLVTTNTERDIKHRRTVSR